MSYDEEEKLKAIRSDVVFLLDSFIEQVNQTRKTLLRVSISALILAPITIALSMYMLSHPSIFEIKMELAFIEIEHEFGIVLIILLTTVITVSSIWVVTGIRQYRSISTWSKRYNEYLREKEEIDKSIASKYGLNEQRDY